MTKTATTDDRQHLLQRIADLEVAKQDAKPKAKGIYTVKIRQATKRLAVLDKERTVEQVLADSKANGDAERKALREKAAAKADDAMRRAEVDAERESNAAFHEAGRTPAAKRSVWQTRVNAAIVEMNDGAEFGTVYICPTPKTATGTADKVRKMLASGKVTAPAGVTFKSHGERVIARLS